MLIGNRGGHLLPYMIHCPWSKKGPEELHQPARFWGVLWTHKWKEGSVIMKDRKQLTFNSTLTDTRAGQNIQQYSRGH